jgi:tyrosyl-tRNA synthetase
MNIIDELTWRGLIMGLTQRDIGDIMKTEQTIYVGFDPTSPSLHVGSLVPLSAMRLLSRHGHKVIAVLGGATGMIGDPSGKSAERTLQSMETIEANKAAISAQIQSILPNAQIVDNLDWFKDISWLDMLRDTGKHFSVNAMMAMDSVKTRIEREGEGISFTEFAYSLMQARDFLELFEKHGCQFQMGASDQWGNICAGIDLVRRRTGKTVHGITLPLLLDARGNKFGKSEGNALTLDASAFKMYQWFLNVDDRDVFRFLKFFTTMTEKEIDSLTVGSAREPQRRLAREVTTWLHGEEATERAIRASTVLYGHNLDGWTASELREIFEYVQSVKMTIDDGISVVELLTQVWFGMSKSEGRRQIEQGGVSVNGKLITDVNAVLSPNELIGGKLLVVKRGKKNIALAEVK